jgi:hypothetical protein
LGGRRRRRHALTTIADPIDAPARSREGHVLPRSLEEFPKREAIGHDFVAHAKPAISVEELSQDRLSILGG